MLDVPPGQTRTLTLQGVFRQGSKLLVEVKNVEVKAGSTLLVDFQGNAAGVTRIPLSPRTQKQPAGK